MTPLDDANHRQLAASDPARDVFVAASAGSGKTKLLTDRLLRLMLAGAAPERILCLTFTKAGAAEMAIRLRVSLGRWVTMRQDALAAELDALGVAPDGPDARPTRTDRARALFGKVLDLPGGMRIETIHAFCQSLLRRFPLEALISPHFRLVDERDTAQTLAEAREHVLAGELEESAISAVSWLASVPEFSGLLTQFVNRRGQLEWLYGIDGAARRARVFAAAEMAHADEDSLLAAAARWPQAQALAAQLELAVGHGSPKVAERASLMLDWLEQSPAQRAEPAQWEVWRQEFFNKDGKLRGFGSFPNKNLAASHPTILPALLAEQARVEAVELARAGLRMAQASDALLGLALPILRRYETRKDRAAHLDYDDLIGVTLKLLKDPGVAWVLYKLDGGVDHVLLDEVQDTSPDQWRIARAITDEFFAGQGARAEVARSFFAVGDRKQSIFSFQGADIASFERQRQEIGQLARAARRNWHDTSLEVSFRSTPAILNLVDAVFADPLAAQGVAIAGEVVRHQTSRQGQAGSVLLWPLAARPPKQNHDDIPDKNQSASSAASRLADRLAGWIAGQTDGSVMLHSRGRALRPGDVMILVRQRNGFARALVRRLKAIGVPVAGIDRMVLTEQPAVQDLLALCDTLLLPQDDLALGCVLTSPLGGLDDISLMQLAATRGRDESLWDALRRRADAQADWRAAWTYLAALFARVDFDTPHALLVSALATGRARLFARLGPEAAEPVDELLSAALEFEAQHPPSLQGFVHWLRQTAAAISRQPGTAEANEVRLLTVHGAKGLQAPLVILPDTTGLPPDRQTLAWVPLDADGTAMVPLWTPRKELRGAVADRLAVERAARGIEEYNRLLYVALTRAEDRLLICGTEPKRLDQRSWYSIVERAMGTLAAAPVAFAPWDPSQPGASQPGAPEPRALEYGTPQTAPPAPDRPAAPAGGVVAALPCWAGTAPDWRPAAPPTEPALPARLAPSRPEGIEHGPVPPALSPLGADGTRAEAIQRGLVLHALLQHLPGLPADTRADAARRYAARLFPDAAEQIADEALAVIDAPALAALFGPGARAEVPLAGVVGQHVIGGLVDRLVVLPGRVMLCDYKTNRRAPDRPEATPVRYLRQMASYRALLATIYPDHEIICILVWTHGGGAMTLPPELLDRHAPGAGIAD